MCQPDILIIPLFEVHYLLSSTVEFIDTIDPHLGRNIQNAVKNIVNEVRCTIQSHGNKMILKASEAGEKMKEEENDSYCVRTKAEK